MRNLFLLSVVIFFALSLRGQSHGNLRSRSISTIPDSIVLDTLSLVPNTIHVFSSGNEWVDTSAYSINFWNGMLNWNKQSSAFRNLQADSVRVVYRCFSFLFGESLRHKNVDRILKSDAYNPFYYNPSSNQPELFKIQGLARSGSISRGITFGNNQDVFVNSSLNLQLAGKLNEHVDILAAITDENIPIQPEGNTQQLQEFDKVFIQLSNERNKLIAGDFELRRPESYFMNFFKKGQGGLFTSVFDLRDPKKIPERKREMKVGASVAISKGKFTKNLLVTNEGNQGPYRLHGGNNESYIVVLSGTEKVYIDGLPMTRGLQNDYIIDYNTAEITFTTRRMITKDSRVSVEFEYSDKNYSRSLLYFNNEFESDRLRVRFNVYSEQDSKNQPLQITLDSTKKSVMAAVGDSIQLAYIPTGDSVAFNSSQVLYARRDTVTGNGAFTIFVYSANADSARWQVTFTDLGAGNGDYIAMLNPANGRVYKWIEPSGNIHQGNYAPVSFLVTPKKQQLLTLGADYKLNKLNSLHIETALSNNDVNLFSKNDKSNDAGFATHLQFLNTVLLDADSLNGWRLNSQLNYEFAEKNFKPVERYRQVEFERDWNLGTSSLLNDEHLGSVETSISKKSLGSLSYQLKGYQKGSDYKGLMNMAATQWTWKNFNTVGHASFLNTSGLNNHTHYLRHDAELSRTFWKIVAGIRENAERNKFYAGSADTLQTGSRAYQEWQAYLSTRDTSKEKAILSYKQRFDFNPLKDLFRKSVRADEVNLGTEFSRNPNNSMRTTTTYRKLNYLDSSNTTQAETKTLLNRMEHTLSIRKGVVTANSFYEVSTGQERKQEYYYLEVPAGQGVYAWLGDINNNGVKDLDEFAISSFADQATFIRVFVPTNDYITTRSNQFSEVISISPGSGSSFYVGKKKFLHRFSNQLSLRLDKKTKDESLLSSLNPFSRELGDSNLVSANSNFRNILYFNRTSSVWSLDFTWQENHNKSILTNGTESRKQKSGSLNGRLNLNRNFLFNMILEKSQKENSSEFFSTRDYHILSESAEPKLSYQPGLAFRLTASYKYLNKRNTIGSNGERVNSDKFGIEMKYSSANAGILNARMNMVNIRYNSEEISFLSYELLEGLKNGKNFTWNVSVQRNLSSSMQLSLNYDGRKLQDSPIVHTGGIQLRAFF